MNPNRFLNHFNLCSPNWENKVLSPPPKNPVFNNISIFGGYPGTSRHTMKFKVQYIVVTQKIRKEIWK